MRLLRIAFIPLVALLLALTAMQVPASQDKATPASASIERVQAFEANSIKYNRQQSIDQASRSKARKLEAARLARIKAAKAAAAKAEAARVAKAQAAKKKAAKTVYVGRVSSAGNRALGKQMAAQRGWTGQQWYCLERLWTRESNWRTNADNPNSSAYGIPQAMGGAMASAGADWRTNPATQIRWGLGYIGNRYGTPCGAWGHFLSHHWY
jgi:hypothetical protein